jgi:diketogulonate reductase-like aldo/keto reductase
MILDENLTLSGGIQIPKIALGTWLLSNEQAYSSTKYALQLGYRHVDTAAAYENEEGVGRAVRQSGLARDKIFVTSKVPAEIKSYDGAVAAIEQSLKTLNIGYIDLMLIHAPKPWKEMHEGSDNNYDKQNAEVWKALEKFHAEGLLKSIGVSNFSIADLENIFANGSVMPCANQIRVHIGHTPKTLIDYCKGKGIVVTAYSPNATGHLQGKQVIEDIAKKYGVSIPQLGIKYDLQLGLIPLPRSAKAEHIRQNVQLNFEISPEDMLTLSKVEEINNLG